MTQGKSGYFDLTGSVSSFAVRVNWSQSYDETTNKSVVTITSVQVKSTNYTGYTYYPDGIIKINGVQALKMDMDYGNHLVAVSSKNTWYSVKGATSGAVTTASVEVEHNTDGSKSVTIEVIGNTYSNCKFSTVGGGGGSGWGVSGSKTVELATIPRASTIGATDANIEGTSAVVVTRKSTAYTHSVKYQFGALTGYLTAAGGLSSAEVKLTETSIAWAIPAAFYNQIPSAKSGVCTLTCKTYSGNTQIGDAQTCAMTLTAAEAACKPTISGAVVDINTATKALTGDENKLIRYHSTARCTIAATAKNGATLSLKTIAGQSVTGNSLDISNVETDTFVFTATDSRGYTATVTVKKTLVPYVRLTNNASCYRPNPTDGTATISYQGNYFNGSFGSVSNALTVSYEISSGDTGTATPTIQNNAYTGTTGLTDMDYTQSFTITVTVSDKLETVEKTVTLMQGIPVYYWGKNDFHFSIPVDFGSGARLDIDTVQSGFVCIPPEDTPDSLWAMGIRVRLNDKYTVERVTETNGKRYQRMYSDVGGYGEWEEENPPLVVGTVSKSATYTANSFTDVTFDLTKDGYTPLMVSLRTSGNSNVVLIGVGIRSANTATATLRNLTGTAATGTAIVEVLYMKS